MVCAGFDEVLNQCRGILPAGEGDRAVAIGIGQGQKVDIRRRDVLHRFR